MWISLSVIVFCCIIMSTATLLSPHENKSDIVFLQNWNETLKINTIKISSLGNQTTLSYTFSKTPITFFSFSGWYGRLGNEFRTRKNMIALTIYCRSILRVQSLKGLQQLHPITFVDSRAVSISGSNTGTQCAPCQKRVWTSKDAFYLDRTMRKACSDFLSITRVAGRTAILMIGAEGPGRTLTGELCSDDHSRLDTVFGHLRSGDIFPSKGKKTHSLYGQPPFLYWWRIISNFSRATLYVEDLHSPVAKLLLSASRPFRPRIQVHVSAPLTQVLNDLVCARTVIMGHSSMAAMVANSWNIRKLFVPYECDNDFLIGTSPEIMWSALIDRSDYTVASAWKGTPSQILETLVFDPTNISPVSCIDTRHEKALLS